MSHADHLHGVAAVHRRGIAERDGQPRWGRLPSELVLQEHEEELNRAFLRTAGQAERLGDGPLWRSLLFEPDTWNDDRRFVSLFYWQPETPATIMEAVDLERLADRGDYTLINDDWSQWQIEPLEIAEMVWRTRVLGSAAMLRPVPRRQEHLFSVWVALGVRLWCSHDRLVEDDVEDLQKTWRHATRFREWQDEQLARLSADGLAPPDLQAYVERHMANWPTGGG